MGFLAVGESVQAKDAPAETQDDNAQTKINISLLERSVVAQS
jgi:hypothetical protein